MKDSQSLILVVDDNPQHADFVSEQLKKTYPDTVAVYEPARALSILSNKKVDLVITEWHFAEAVTGMEILRQAQLSNPYSQVIVVTSHSSVESCKSALKNGALDYLEKPIDISSLLQIISKALPRKKVSYQAVRDFIFEGVLSRNHAMQSIYSVLRRVSPTNISVLVEGESGTGKELIAKAVHDNSHRKNKTFKPVNCAGFTESLLESELFGHSKGAFTGALSDRKGLFEIADKGTLFLDEIGDMPLQMQAKLLRVLDNGVIVPVGSNTPKVVDVRVISATNHDLKKLVDENKFRQDLYFRIKGVSVTVPPLRDRSEDIPELFGYFLKQSCMEVNRNITRITESAMNILVNYHWPGNIRQLRHAVRTMVVMCSGDTITPRDIPPDIYRMRRLSGSVARQNRILTQIEGDQMSLKDLEQQHIKNVLESTSGNRSEAASILGIGERTLYRKIKEYGLE